MCNSMEQCRTRNDSLMWCKETEQCELKNVGRISLYSLRYKGWCLGSLWVRPLRGISWLPAFFGILMPPPSCKHGPKSNLWDNSWCIDKKINPKPPQTEAHNPLMHTHTVKHTQKNPQSKQKRKGESSFGWYETSNQDKSFFCRRMVLSISLSVLISDLILKQGRSETNCCPFAESSATFSMEISSNYCSEGNCFSNQNLQVEKTNLTFCPRLHHVWVKGVSQQ